MMRRANTSGRAEINEPVADRLAVKPGRQRRAFSLNRGYGLWSPLPVWPVTRWVAPFSW
jgi:hypothetical protein